MLKINIIRDEHYLTPRSMLFQRAARTDKHVSAIRQVVSLKCSEQIVEKIDKLNEFMPEEIRVMSCKRVTQGFDSKNFCDNRTYSYLMPSFALCPKTQTPDKTYRLPSEELKLFNSVLDGYRGVHLFHNFTSGKSPKDQSATRVIRYMNCSEPFFPGSQNEMEFVVIRVKGQSFMMHQIRKMIGLAIAVVKGYVPKDEIRRAMDRVPVDVPKAPGVGLMLEEAHFETYNRKWAHNGSHQALEWSDVNEKISDFKEKYIYPVVINEEINKGSMLEWLEVMKYHYSFEAQQNENRSENQKKDLEDEQESLLDEKYVKKAKMEDQGKEESKSDKQIENSGDKLKKSDVII